MKPGGRVGDGEPSGCRGSDSSRRVDRFRLGHCSHVRGWGQASESVASSASKCVGSHVASQFESLAVEAEARPRICLIRTDALHVGYQLPTRRRTGWRRHSQLSSRGVWDQILVRLLAQADAAGEVHWRVSVDSTSARVHQHAATLSREVALMLPSHSGGTVELQGSAS